MLSYLKKKYLMGLLNIKLKDIGIQKKKSIYCLDILYCFTLVLFKKHPNYKEYIKWFSLKYFLVFAHKGNDCKAKKRYKGHTNSYI